MISEARKTRCGRIGVRTLALLIGLTGPAVSQEKKIAVSDSFSFLEAEHNVRHEFVQRYPLLDQFSASMGSQASKNRYAADLMKRFDQLPDDQKFAPDFGYVMEGKVKIKKKTALLPSYWQRSLAGLMKALPFGDAMAKTYLGGNAAKTEMENSEAPNRLALDNMQNFRELAVGYKIASGEDFDHAAALARTRYILTMFGKAQEDVSLPCPFSIYLLDVDTLASSDTDGPSVPREIIGHLLGKKSPEYLQFPEDSREQKSVALKHAYLHLLADAQRVATVPSAETLNGYLQFAALQLSATNGNWYIADEFNKVYSFSDLMRATFGDAELQKFNREPEGPEKDADRVAVILLWTQYRLGTSGWMIG
jgi:hypothetical protein